MRESSFEAESKAYAALTELMRSAREVERLFQAAGVDIPPALARMFGDGTTSGGGKNHRKQIASPMESPDRPQEAQTDWIWVEASELLTTNLILSLMRAEGDKAVTAKHLFECALKYDPNVNQVTIFNVGARIDGKLIHRGDDGWRLIDPLKVPLMFEGNAWGPVDVFAAPEIAAYRRAVIQHLLKKSFGGLMTMQIVDALKQFDGKFPVNKDLVRADLEAMQTAGIIKHVGNSRKWTVI
jgi:hypothetical protein